MSDVLRTPLLEWREGRKFTREKVCSLVKKAGGQLKPRSLLEMENGRRRPSYRLAKIFVQVSGETLEVDQILDFPYPETKKATH